MKVKFNCITRPVKKGAGNNNNLYNLLPEEYIIYCARVSSKERVNNGTAPKLLKYLIDNKHWSPFEMISIGFEVETSRAIAQQILRHRSFSFQEFSQCYAMVEDMERVELRYQAKENRQSSTDAIEDNILTHKVDDHIRDSQLLYNELLENDVAKECARMILPLTTQTTIIMHGTLRSWIHFLDQRCDEHAQKEIREIAFEIRKKLSKICPWTSKALGWY